MSTWQFAALAVGALMSAPAPAQYYHHRDDSADEFVIADPFNERTTAAMQVIARGAMPAKQGRMLSIGYSVEKKTRPFPGAEDPVFDYHRTIRFDASWFLNEVDRVAGSLEWTDCDRFRVDPARLVSVSRHRLEIEVKYKLTTRSCGWTGTHNTGSARGWQRIGISLADDKGNPRINVATLDSDYDASVFGMDANNFFAGVVYRIAHALEVGLTNPGRLPSTLGRLPLDLLRPINLSVTDQAVADPSRFFDAAAIARIRTLYGSFAAWRANSDAQSPEFDLAKSGFRRQRVYKVKPAYASRLNDELCTAMGGLTNISAYCSPTGEDRLVIELKETATRFDFYRPGLVEMIDEEMRLLDSLDTSEIEHLDTPQVLYPIISERFYGPRGLTFFQSNNASPPCFFDNVQSKEMCRYRIVPIWMIMTRDEPASEHPLAPGADFSRAVAADTLP
jgi:hypothetical protein